MNQDAFGQIAISLTKHFECLHYVDIETGKYKEYTHMKALEALRFPPEGEDFFADVRDFSGKCIHPEDLDLVRHIHTRENMLERLHGKYSSSMVFRMIIDGKIVRMRHTAIMCEDKKHIICCLEDVEDDIRSREEQAKNLQSARRMARRDELTGIRNKNAYMEYIETVDNLIRGKAEEFHFGVVMCDVNDLKLINDTRGHSFGDEAIQRASRMICDIYDHSPVFRIGGDEFVVIVTDRDYEHKEELLNTLREESLSHKRTKSGPVVACGMSVYDPDTDDCFDRVYERADRKMYENKNELKSMRVREGFKDMEKRNTPISKERKQKLDTLFGALLTIAGEGYIFLNDMHYDYSRWSLQMVDDFDIESEYLYRAGDVWRKHIHPDDVEIYQKVIDQVFGGNAEFRPLFYRARKPDGTYVLLTTRGFILMDEEGKPEYFGGIILPK